MLYVFFLIKKKLFLKYVFGYPIKNKTKYYYFIFSLIIIYSSNHLSNLNHNCFIWHLIRLITDL